MLSIFVIEMYTGKKFHVLNAEMLKKCVPGL